MSVLTSLSALRTSVSSDEHPGLVPWRVFSRYVFVDDLVGNGRSRSRGDPVDRSPGGSQEASQLHQQGMQAFVRLSQDLVVAGGVRAGSLQRGHKLPTRAHP